MSEDEKRFVREFVEDNGYNIIWLAGELPNSVLEEKVWLVYEHAGGWHHICRATYKRFKMFIDLATETECTYKAEFVRDRDGFIIPIEQCIAWKKWEG